MDAMEDDMEDVYDMDETDESCIAHTDAFDSMKYRDRLASLKRLEQQHANTPMPTKEELGEYASRAMATLGYDITYQGYESTITHVVAAMTHSVNKLSDVKVAFFKYQVRIGRLYFRRCCRRLS
jgi:hypothetical protein